MFVVFLASPFRYPLSIYRFVFFFLALMKNVCRPGSCIIITVNRFVEYAKGFSSTAFLSKWNKHLILNEIRPFHPVYDFFKSIDLLNGFQKRMTLNANEELQIQFTFRITAFYIIVDFK